MVLWLISCHSHVTTPAEYVWRGTAPAPQEVCKSECLPLLCIQYMMLLCVLMKRNVRKQKCEAEIINDTVILISVSQLVSRCLREDIWLDLTVFQENHGK